MAIDLMQSNSEPNKKKINPIIIGVITAIVLSMTLCVVFMMKGLTDYNEMKHMQLVWTEIQHIADSKPENPDDIISEVIDENGNKIQVTPENNDDDLYRQINLTALSNVNPDVSGYIYIPGTKVNYPILKEPEAYTYYYLDHNINYEHDKYGSIFEISDKERGLPEFDNAVNVMFGHHMASGAMFTGLYNYYYQDTRDEYIDNPIYVYRGDIRIEYRVAALCIVKENDIVYDFDAYGRNSENYRILLKHLEDVKVKDIKFNQPMPTESDNMLVLSTCYGEAGTQWRLIVICGEYRKVTVPNGYNSLGDPSITN